MFAQSDSAVLMDPKTAAKRLGLTAQFLAIDRHKSIQSGAPPLIPYVKIGPRIVRYAVSDLDAFVKNSRVGA